jgi:hypothetical protein
MKGSSKPARAKPVEKPISLFPLTLEEAVDKLLKVTPSHSRAKKPASPKTKS